MNIKLNAVLKNKPQAWHRDNWYSRGYLPHFKACQVVQSITIRLHDTLPQNKLNEFRHYINTLNDTKKDREIREYIDKWLDHSYGACFLSDSRVGSLVVESLLHKHGKEYDLYAWVVMPNHLHFMLSIYEGFSLHEVIKNFKSYTAKNANVILGRSGPFWFREYYDRYIRDEEHYCNVIYYKENNPVKAGLCVSAEEWQFSSAYARKYAKL